MHGEFLLCPPPPEKNNFNFRHQLVISLIPIDKKTHINNRFPVKFVTPKNTKLDNLS